MYLAFLWHMHQPCYKDPQTGRHLMPWVRLHALKDYFDMTARLESFPGLRCNVNVVPSLMMQLEDCQRLDVDDEFLNLAQQPASDLEPADRVFLLEHFFSLNWEHLVKPYPRYGELLQMRKSAARGDGIWDIAQFSQNDYRDLQLWFYLAWSGESLRREPVIRRLISKGRNFSEAEKQELFEVQRIFIAKIAPAYQRLHAGGRIELSCSPLYHPILPLLCDARSARVALPELPLPEPYLRSPEDAEYQVREAVRYMAAHLGVRPRGIWPSEGAISVQAVGQMIDAGLDWTASDEIVLQRSLGDGKKDTHFFPYRFARENGAISIFFRDRTLSDLIGFTYSQWPSKEAALDLMSRLTQWARVLDPDAVVSIILDGENAWEYYPENGRVFWEEVFTLLVGQTEIQPITFSEYLDHHPPKLELQRLHPGSWIQGDFKIWIGHSEKNRAWELLAETRATAAARTSRETNPEVWEQIYIAEGSDWFWWYGDDHYSADRDKFDLLFRKHLLRAYEKMGVPLPAALDHPILERKVFHAVEPPLAELSPTLDGRVTDYFEWLGAGRISSAVSAGAMHPAASVLKQVLFGFNRENLFLRLDLMNGAAIRGEGCWEFEISFRRPVCLSVEIVDQSGVVSAWLVQGTRRERLPSFALQKIIELAVPLEAIGGKPDEEIQWFIQIRKDGRPLQRWPRTEVFSLILKLERERYAWLV